MTAFVRHDAEFGDHHLSIEIRSVNHRYLDLAFRLPDALRGLEPTLRSRCSTALARGKVEVGLRLRPLARGDAAPPQAQLAAAIGRIRAVVEAIDTAGLRSGPVDPVALAQLPGLFEARAALTESESAAALAAFDAALAIHVAARGREGNGLAVACLQRLDAMAPHLDALSAANDSIAAEQRDRLQRRIDALDVELPPERLAQEVAVLAQRLDIAEELDRLALHVEAAREALTATGPVGRRLDFLLQEFGREANTIASKSGTSTVSNAAVELKVLIEQIREQIQNIE